MPKFLSCPRLESKYKAEVPLSPAIPGYPNGTTPQESAQSGPRCHRLQAPLLGHREDLGRQMIVRFKILLREQRSAISQCESATLAAVGHASQRDFWCLDLQWVMASLLVRLVAPRFSI